AVEPEVGGIPAQRRRTGLLLGVVALLPYAALAPLSGRPWLQAELFGLAPDPTVLFSLAVLLLRPLPACASPGARRLARALWVLPVAWCVCSSATLALLGSWQAALPVGAAALCWWACRPRRAAGPR
ncbi:MAG: hypothetical protein JNJ71_21495, partial [Rubrivivax sp.]|nr:hypothetical protein [Rubrivivax sp.]